MLQPGEAEPVVPGGPGAVAELPGADVPAGMSVSLQIAAVADPGMVPGAGRAADPGAEAGLDPGLRPGRLNSTGRVT